MIEKLAEAVAALRRRVELLEAQDPAHPPWVAPTLLNSWVYWGNPYDTPGYYKGSDGVVHLRGLVKLGTIGQAIFQLPAGYRPPSQQLIGTISDPGTGAVISRLDIDTSGDVIASVGGNGYFSLDNIAFRTS